MRRETIDKRTWDGKDIVKKVQSMCNEKSLRFSEQDGMHPGLVGLRMKDIDFLLLEFNLN